MPDTPLSIEAIRPLVKDPLAATTALEPLFATLACEDEELVAWATDALQGIETIPLERAAVLQAALRSNCTIRIVWACKMMERLPVAEEHQQAVASLLDSHAEVSVRQQAAKSLGAMGTLSEEILSKLQDAAASSDPRLSRMAQRTIERNAA